MLVRVLVPVLPLEASSLSSLLIMITFGISTPLTLIQLNSGLLCSLFVNHGFLQSTV